jgi:hypothetical protein
MAASLMSYKNYSIEYGTERGEAELGRAPQLTFIVHHYIMYRITCTYCITRFNYLTINQ